MKLTFVRAMTALGCVYLIAAMTAYWAANQIAFYIWTLATSTIFTAALMAHDTEIKKKRRRR